MHPNIAVILTGLAMRPNLGTYSETGTVVFIDVVGDSGSASLLRSCGLTCT